MKVDGVPHRTIVSDESAGTVTVIDQTRLPDTFSLRRLATLEDAASAIQTMVVRGAPLIGVTAAFGMWLAMRADPGDAALERAAATLVATRPTAVNLAWAIARARKRLVQEAPSGRAAAAHALATALADEDVATNRALGAHGAALLRHVHQAAGRPSPFVIMTHCNAGWLATVDGGTALAPIYTLADEGLSPRVIVSETRPRNQGRLTAWELERQGIDHRFVVDNACGHLLAAGRVHAVIVGCDRLARNGDVCNKVGTYLKALAARESSVPFFAAVPGSTIDFAVASGAEIPIEERDATEVDARFTAENPAFDVTPARLISAIVTERGVADANEAALRALYPEAR